MKRNIVRISLALILILSLCLSIGSPAIAADNDKKPVASVTWTGSNGKMKDVVSHRHMVWKFHVKKLTDGSVTGEARLTYLDTGVAYEYELIDAYFVVEDGYNVAYILVTAVDGGITWPMCWRFEDRGEPGKGIDLGSNYVYLVPNIDPNLVPWPISSEPDPPWFLFHEPSPVGQIQVKITDAYFD